MWRELVKRHIDDISKTQNIPLSNLKGYEAFHNTTHHSHIRLMVYSSNPRQGYLTKEGMAAIRSFFANDIFYEDMKSIYQEQTLTRDEPKVLFENQMSEIVSLFGSGNVDKELVIKVRELYSQLQSVSGKKVYGYLLKDVKHTVDDILLLLSRDQNIQKLYDKWREFEKAKYRMYTHKEKEFPEIGENKEFRSVKNMIIRTVLIMKNETEKSSSFNKDISSNIERTTYVDNVGDIKAEGNELIMNSKGGIDNAAFVDVAFKLIKTVGNIIEEDDLRSRKNISSCIDKKLKI